MRQDLTDRPRRALLAGAAILAMPGLSWARPAPRWIGRQFHNQPEDSHVHRFLVELWAAVEAESHGALRIVVHAQNAGLPGSDPAALDLMIAGGLEFFALMGGILGKAVPVAEIQGMPFAFTRYDQIDRANSGPLGDLIGRECAARGIHRFRQGTLENGFRQIVMVDRPIGRPEDLAGVRMRVPDGQMFRDLFTAFGAQPVTVNIADLYAALKDRRVDGQENPLVVTEVNRLYEVSRYVSMTNHMWSGFNLLANRGFWDRLPPEVQAVVDRNVRRSVARQRRYTRAFNATLETRLLGRGMVVNRPQVAPFRTGLGSDLYRRWRGQLGATAWRLLEDQVGRLPG